MKEDISKGSKITVSLTEHALSRIAERFDVDDSEQIERVLEEAATDGFVSSDEGDLLIEHGCLLATCSHNGNGTLTVMTVLDLTDGISREMKKRTRNARPTPWEDCEVKMPGGGLGELYLSPSSGSSIFSKTERLSDFLPQQKNSRVEVKP
ncbi:hypothetical protein AKJ51_00120 [candidate division MSBL1 archaeon SCGC-AAA382A20]|uniref:Uncharacterized protein n=1 Tax=candidate division MSBL1 archaeon SCGC-AAA382A20 TaxID=1698280 RepID=A0A133VMX1_9EURY|nr:hypothetical protein AKJ51_00120 [candidate division MSBL1 archaeon SCGC-AAA382A20]